MRWQAVGCVRFCCARGCGGAVSHAHVRSRRVDTAPGMPARSKAGRCRPPRDALTMALRTPAGERLMELTEADVIEILKLFEQSKSDFLQLEQGERKITVSKGGYRPAGTGTAPATASAAAVAPAPPSTPVQSAA